MNKAILKDLMSNFIGYKDMCFTDSDCYMLAFKTVYKFEPKSFRDSDSRVIELMQKNVLKNAELINSNISVYAKINGLKYTLK